MMSVLFLTKLTALLLLGILVLLLSRKASAAVRHLLCTVTLAMAVALPITSRLPVLHHSQLFTYVANASDSLAAHHQSPVHLAGIVWLAGALLILFRFAMGVAYLKGRTRHLLAFMYVENVPILLTDVSTPMLCGWLRPVILLPEDSQSWSSERQRLAIAHELAHYRRHDNWTALIAIAAQALYWFHPCIWWLTAQLEAQRELACDNRVLQNGGSTSEYADLLLDIARQQSSPALFGCAMFTNKNHLKGRIMHILQFSNSHSSEKNRFAIACAISVMALGCLLIPATADQVKVYKIGGDITAPKVIYKLEPQYSEQPKHDKIQGNVLLSLVINADGKPENIQVKRGLNPDLDKNAIEAISHWKFQPATKDGQPVSVEANIEVNFRLK
jgi:TonB family protein